MTNTNPGNETPPKKLNWLAILLTLVVLALMAAFYWEIIREFHQAVGKKGVDQKVIHHQSPQHR